MGGYVSMIDGHIDEVQLTVDMMPEHDQGRWIYEKNPSVAAEPRYLPLVKGEFETDREKLIALLASKPELLKDLNTSPVRLFRFADHLLANGVTIQRWIPVTERLPETTALCIVVKYCVPTLAWYTGKDWIYATTASVAEGITHWMPLPEPPKEVE